MTFFNLIRIHREITKVPEKSFRSFSTKINKEKVQKAFDIASEKTGAFRSKVSK